MRRYVIAAILVLAALFTMPYLPLTPPLKVGEPPPGSRPAARAQLTETAEAGRRVFAGTCARCHGERGEGGSATALSRMALARDFMRVRDLHEAVAEDIRGHAGLVRSLGDGDATERFNTVELMGRYLREIRRRKLRQSR